jgi:hypothetical protein
MCNSPILLGFEVHYALAQDAAAASYQSCDGYDDCQWHLEFLQSTVDKNTIKIIIILIIGIL